MFRERNRQYLLALLVGMTLILGCAVQALAADNLEAVGLLKKDDIIDSFEFRLPHAYPIWDVHSRGNLNTVLDYLESFENLYSVGRQGGFTYGGAADCMDIGFRTARHIAGGGAKSDWKAVRSRFNSYVVID